LFVAALTTFVLGDDTESASIKGGNKDATAGDSAQESVRLGGGYYWDDAMYNDIANSINGLFAGDQTACQGRSSGLP